MNILAIDTSSKVANVSIKSNDKIFNKSISNEITHSEKLLPLIHECFNEANLKLQDIDLFAIINGPGSFTGLRIGLATIKAFANVHKKPIFCISSLLLNAYIEFLNLVNKKDLSTAIIAPLLDAKNSRVYYGLYKFELDSTLNVSNILQPNNELIEDTLNSISSIVNEKDIKEDIYFSSDNISLFSDSINSKNESISTNFYINNENVYMNTDYLIDLYEKLQNPNEFLTNYSSLDALYVRPSQAERLLKNDNK